MNSRTALAVLKRRWRVLVVGVLAGLLVAGVAAALHPDRYVAESAVYVAGLDSVPAPGADFYINTVLVEQRANTYRELLLSRRVLDPVAAQVGVPLGPGTVALTPGAASSVLGVTVVDDDPGRTATIAAAVARSFADTAGRVESPLGAGTPTPRATVLNASPIARETGPSVAAVLLVGVLAGLCGGGAWVLIRHVTKGAGGAAVSAEVPTASETGHPEAARHDGDPA